VEAEKIIRQFHSLYSSCNSAVQYSRKKRGFGHAACMRDKTTYEALWEEITLDNKM